MASHAQLLALVLPLFTALVSANANGTAANNTTSFNSSCSVEDVYLRPNASNSYAIPAIIQSLDQSAESSSNTILSSDTESWQIINALGQTPDPYSAQLGTEELEQLILLDTSRSQPNAPAIPPALAACYFVFNLPPSYIGKLDNGSCVSLIGQSCVNDIHTAAQTLAEAASQANGTDLFSACNAINQGLSNLPQSCPQQNRGTEYQFGIREWGGNNLTYNDASECGEAPESLPIPIFEQITEVQKGNTTVYDQWARTTWPVLLAFFSNGTIFHGSPFADTTLVCTTPKNVAGGSHNPTSAADPSISVDAKSMVAMFLALNALLFFVL